MKTAMQYTLKQIVSELGHTSQFNTFRHVVVKVACLISRKFKKLYCSSSYGPKHTIIFDHLRILILQLSIELLVFYILISFFTSCMYYCSL